MSSSGGYEFEPTTMNDKTLENHNAGVFEGPEKNLELDFKRSITEKAQGQSRTTCRDISRTELDTLLASAQCQILSKISSEDLDAYVLSESSLFVYDYKILIKTCGTTTLLKCLPELLHLTQSVLGMSRVWIYI